MVPACVVLLTFTVAVRADETEDKLVKRIEAGADVRPETRLAPASQSPLWISTDSR